MSDTVRVLYCGECFFRAAGATPQAAADALRAHYLPDGVTCPNERPRDVDEPLCAPVHAARRTDPGTSHAAARRIASSATRLERVVVEELRAAGPLTAHEIAQRVNLPLVTISPRLAPLVRSGVVADSGERRERRTVWRVLP